MKHIKIYEQFNPEYLDDFSEEEIFGENNLNAETKLKDPRSMRVGKKYRITELVYDDYDEGLELEPYTVKVVKKDHSGVILRDDENFNFKRTFSHLRECDIVQID